MAKLPDSIGEYFKPGTKIYQVYNILRDKNWHCRECEYQHIGITQIAGGSGIQGLQRGTNKRPGMVIESDNLSCSNCNRVTRQDRWQGQLQLSVHAGTMPHKFIEKVLRIFARRDVVEGTRRSIGELTIDHKFPMIRWNNEISEKLTDYGNMSDDDIKSHFQLLKKSNGSVSHNLLKSRACERCFQNGQRGEPFGIRFYYSGNAKWAPTDKYDPIGCIGCGWYDFDLWRKHLNEQVQDQSDLNVPT